MRFPLLLAASTMLASASVAALPQQTAAAPVTSDDVTWCGSTPTAPCLVSATVDGTDVKSSSAWDLSATAYSVGDSEEIAVHLLRKGDDELGAASLDKVVRVEVLTGDLIPRLVTGKARDTGVTRTFSGSKHTVSVTGNPVVVSGQCDQDGESWTCPEDSPEEWVGYFDFIVSDHGSWEDEAQRDAFYGMNYFTNVAATSVPPEITENAKGDPMLLIRLANRHYLSDGETVVQGHGELRIPNDFLREVYGIPDPATMTGASLLPSLSGKGAGTVDSRQESGDGAMLVTYDAVEFSARKLRIETGKITPVRPTQVSATRTAPRKGSVDFEPSVARGAAVTGYAGRCKSVRGDHTVRASSENIVRFTGLRKGTAYDCRVKAKSEVGTSSWTEAVRMGAKVVDVS